VIYEIMHRYAVNVNIFRIIIHKKEKECYLMHKKEEPKFLFLYEIYY